jgi:hypothetical protein
MKTLTVVLILLKDANAATKEFLKAANIHIHRFPKAAGIFTKKIKIFSSPATLGQVYKCTSGFLNPLNQ